MKSLHIVKETPIPVDLATQSVALIARKGQGKTYTARVMIEEFVDAGVQVLVVATVGNYYGLRLAADGKGKGYDIPILGGLRGDVPLTETGGKVVADLVQSTGRSFIVDVSQFSKSARVRFCTALFERLWELKKAEMTPQPLHVVVEEAQLLVPQMVRPDGAALYGIVEEVVRLGRNYGIGVTLITQRPQSVNKEVLSQTEVLFTFQIGGKHDRKAIKDWIEENDGDLNLLVELTKLQPGEAFLWSPSWLRWFGKVHVRRARTYDSSATPKVGEKRPERALAALDLDAVKVALAETIERAKADDPKALRAELARVKAELAKKPAPAAAKVEHRDRPVLKDGQLTRVEKLAEKLPAMIASAQAVVDRLVEENDHVTRALSEVARSAAPRVVAGGKTWEQRFPVEPQFNMKSVPVPMPKKIRAALVGDAANLGKGELLVLAAIAQHAAGVTREQLTVITRYKRSSRDSYLQRLRTAGLIADGEVIVVTAEGQALCDARGIEALPTGAALLQLHLRKLPEGEGVILALLAEAYPGAVDRDVISERTPYARSSRDSYLQRLRARQLITEPSRGMVRASDLLFDSPEAANG